MTDDSDRASTGPWGTVDIADKAAIHPTRNAGKISKDRGYVELRLANKQWGSFGSGRSWSAGRAALDYF